MQALLDAMQCANIILFAYKCYDNILHDTPLTFDDEFLENLDEISNHYYICTLVCSMYKPQTTCSKLNNP